MIHDDLLENIEEKWKSVGEHYLSSVPDGFEVISLEIKKNPFITKGGPSYLLKAEVKDIVADFTYETELNALKILRELNQKTKYS